MKPWNELTFIEKASLTEEQVRKYIRNSAIEEGLRLPVEFEMTVPEPEHQKPDVRVYEIAGKTFVDEASAIEVQQVLEKLKFKMVTLDYDYSNYQDKYISDKDTSVPPIEHKLVYSHELYMKCSGQIREYKKKKDSYEKQLKDFKEATKGVDKLSSEFWDSYWNAITKTRKKKQMDMVWNEYKTAVPDLTKAKELFGKAYSIESADVLQSVLNEEPVETLKEMEA